MKKIFSTLFLIVFVFAFSQNARAIYEYKFRSDSTKTDSLKTEWMYLDIKKEGSSYYSKKAFDEDSIIAESIKKQMASGMKSLSVSRNRIGGESDFKVFKTYPDFKTKTETSIGNDNYLVLEDREMIWKILPDKAKIGEFNAQKAETDFGGRHWTAWFSAEVPFQDGPYKFHGLPGLIVKVEDKTGSHIMELKALKKEYTTSNNDVNLPEGKSIPMFGAKPIEVNRKQYVKKLEEHQMDPVQGMRQMLNMPNSKVVVNIGGVEYTDPKDVLKQMEKMEREEMQRNNNKIELQP